MGSLLSFAAQQTNDCFGPLAPLSIWAGSGSSLQTQAQLRLSANRTFTSSDCDPQPVKWFAVMFAVLLAVIDSDGRTSVRRYLDDNSVLEITLAAVGNSKQLAEVEEEASTFSSDKVAMRQRAIANGLQQAAEGGKAPQTSQPVSQ